MLTVDFENLAVMNDKWAGSGTMARDLWIQIKPLRFFLYQFQSSSEKFDTALASGCYGNHMAVWPTTLVANSHTLQNNKKKLQQWKFKYAKLLTVKRFLTWLAMLCAVQGTNSHSSTVNRFYCRRHSMPTNAERTWISVDVVDAERREYKILKWALHDCFVQPY